MWNRIALELEKIEKKNEVAIIVGDLNKHLGLEIKDNRDKVSFGGKVLRDFLKDGNYVLLNATDKVKNGPFTRYDPTFPLDDSLKSCLDLVIVSTSLFQYVSELIIDKEMNFTPCHPISNGRMVFTDHYGLLLVLKGMPLHNSTRTRGKKCKVWNLNKENGWKVYYELTNDNGTRSAQVAR